MISDYLEAVRKPDQQVNPLFSRLGVEVVRIQPDEAELALTIRRDHLQGAGVVAGGVIAALLDEAMAHAVLAGLEDAQQTATVELSTRYMRTVREGQRVVAYGRVLKRGRRVVTVEAELRMLDGELAAKALASFLVS